MSLIAVNRHFNYIIMTGATYIDFDKARTTGMRLIRTKENPTAGLMIIVGIHVGLRIGDLLSLTYGDLRGEIIKLKEQKTGKIREIKVHDAIHLAMSYFPYDYHPDQFHAFRSQKGTVYSNKHVNRLLTKYFPGDRVSSHSLRKSFGRRVYNVNGKSEDALTTLSEIFAHRDISTTRKYLGIRQEQINDVYMNL